MEAKLIMDGTFKSAPNLFTQLFTIHGLFPDGWRLPLFYGLLPGKTTTLYRNLLEELDSWGPYQPQSILLDYELAIHNAVAEVYPSSSNTYDKQTWRHLKPLLPSDMDSFSTYYENTWIGSSTQQLNL
ncbi:hypothetical protein ACHWQZ_G009636 [Mnemiopsis leidyi]